jgi:DNA transformation protein and related proteins
MPARNPFLEFLHEQFAPLGQIDSRSMFGGYCLYCDGVVFGLVANNQVFLKADEVNRPDFEARNLPAFRPFDDQDVVMQYYEAPPEVYENHDAVRHWCGGALEAGRRSRVKKKGARGRRARAGA